MLLLFEARVYILHVYVYMFMSWREPSSIIMFAPETGFRMLEHDPVKARGGEGERGRERGRGREREKER